MEWKSNKEFAFTIIDDTDCASISNVKPIYDYLNSRGLKTTKTVWIYPPRDGYSGQTLQDVEYLEFLQELRQHGFEIQLHSVGSGSFSREEILLGLEIFKENFGSYPAIQINHASNPDSIYFGSKRFGRILNYFMKLLMGETREFYGDVKESEHFWGDAVQKHILFIRNRIFNGINTLKYDPRMPFREKHKPYSNYWFSSSDGHTVEEFNQLISERNVRKLRKQQGLCIVYTHFAYGFIGKDGEINGTFKKNIDFLSSQNGWFVPASEILTYLAKRKDQDYVHQYYLGMVDLRWVFDRLIKKIRFGR